jgi:hypothetical protein
MFRHGICELGELPVTEEMAREKRSGLPPAPGREIVDQLAGAGRDSLATSFAMMLRGIRRSALAFIDECIADRNCKQ